MTHPQKDVDATFWGYSGKDVVVGGGKPSDWLRQINISSFAKLLPLYRRGMDDFSLVCIRFMYSFQTYLLQLEVHLGNYVLV
jgi:hypothetical protein